MDLFKSKALVLRRIPYGEADTIVTCLSEEGRLIKGFAPSERSSRKRFGGVLDLFNQVEVQWKENRNSELVRLQLADLVCGMEGVRNDLSKFAAACYFAELILVFHKENEKGPAVYNDFVVFLEEHKNHETFEPHLVPLMEHRFLDLLGFRPELSVCLDCRESIHPDRDYFFQGKKGGIVCSKCKTRLNGSFENYPLSYKLLDLISREFHKNPRQWKSNPWSPVEVHSARRALEYFIQYTAGKPFKSLGFLSKILSS